MALLNLDQDISSKPLDMSFSSRAIAPYEAFGVALARYLMSWIMSRFPRGGSLTLSSLTCFFMLTGGGELVYIIGWVRKGSRYELCNPKLPYGYQRARRADRPSAIPLRSTQKSCMGANDMHRTSYTQ